MFGGGELSFLSVYVPTMHWMILCLPMHEAFVVHNFIHA